MTETDTKVDNIVAEIRAAINGSVPEIRLSVGAVLTHKEFEFSEDFDPAKTVTRYVEREVVARLYNSTRDAYDISQYDDDVKDGDILIVPSEGVVGILVQAWPSAVTEEHGEFHVTHGRWSEVEDGRYSQIVAVAERIIAAWGVEDQPHSRYTDGEVPVIDEPRAEQVDAILTLLEPVDPRLVTARAEALEQAASAVVATSDDLPQRVRIYADLLETTVEDAINDVVARYREMTDDDQPGMEQYVLRLVEAASNDGQTQIMPAVGRPGRHVSWDLIIVIFVLGVVSGIWVERVVMACLGTFLHWVFGLDLVVLYHVTHLL